MAARAELPSGTVTFLFTDIEGSTKLLHELGAEAYAENLAEHRKVVRAACTARGGVEVDTQGDAFFVAFPTAPEALAAAHAITEELASGPIALRIGLHTGTPLVAGEGYVGEDVHFAARVATSAHGGQVVLSQATRALVDEPHPLLELGEHRLKDIAEPVAIYQLGEGQFPPLKTISNTNLPRPASSFVGRERELEEVLGRIGRGARLVTLTGPGGSGKTRLALEAAAMLVPEYKAGVFWIGLASLRDPALVSATMAQTLSAKDGLAEHIGEREMLLLLDNLEQVIEAAPELSGLLQACPNLTLLVTSREVLRIQGEVEYPVPPLADAEAVSLFCERAQTTESEEIAELCARLDNLPLAVELAAARTKLLSPRDILERLSQRLDLLKGGRDAAPRQQTLRATIAWSYDLLRQEEKRLFARLSVFSGGWTLEAAEQVCDADLDTLASLLDKSLVRRTNGRFFMLETVREYALERLEIVGETERLRQLHATWALEVVSTDAPRQVGAVQAGWLERLDQEEANVRAALEVLADGDPRLPRFVDACHYFWTIRSKYAEGLRWVERALPMVNLPELRLRLLSHAADQARALGEMGLALAYADKALSEARQSEDHHALVRALRDLGNVLVVSGEVERAEACFRESLSVATAVGDVHGRAAALGNLGDVVAGRGDYEGSLEYWKASGELAQEMDDREGLMLASFNAGFALLMLGSIREAEPLLYDALRRAADSRWPEQVMFGLESLAAVAVARGEPERAATLAGAAQALREAVGFAMETHETRRFEQAVAETRAALDGDAFEQAIAEGRRKTLEEAVAYALEEETRQPV